MRDVHRYQIHLAQRLHGILLWICCKRYFWNTSDNLNMHWVLEDTEIYIYGKMELVN